MSPTDVVGSIVICLAIAWVVSLFMEPESEETRIRKLVEKLTKEHRDAERASHDVR